ncbi:hypothetical protein ACFWAY_39645 [Rhodococcus sp. NPDC059968]|uniref:hypothetical protein n=1 Tax=Rhodococcus sp. NPDC059968 TaxID=3347017 RepID=UPI0036701B3E
MRITERTARQYFDQEALRTLARELALSIKEEAPVADLLTLPRTVAIPLSTLGVLTRGHDDDLPTVWVPEPLLIRAVRLVENTADLVQQGSHWNVRPHLQKALSEDAARLRALDSRHRPTVRLGSVAVPDDPS